MISILLIILKIIGITLLVILGLIVFLLLILLFVPIRYRFKGNYDDSFHCKGKVTWLLHFISIKIEVEKEVVTSIRILGIPLSVLLKKKKEDVLSEEVKTLDGLKTDETRVTKEKPKDSVQQLEPGESQIVQSKENVVEDTDGQQEKEEVNEGKSQIEKKSIIQKIFDFFNICKKKVIGIVNQVRKVIQKIKDFIVNINDKKKQVKRYLRILQSDTTKAAFSLCKKKILKMLKHIFPRKLRAELTFGFDDPATTGYTLAVYGMLPEFIGKNILLHPDFDKQIFEGQFKVKGAIRAWTLLYQVLSILMDKNCRKLYYIVKKEISNEHK